MGAGRFAGFDRGLTSGAAELLLPGGEVRAVIGEHRMNFVGLAPIRVQNRCNQGLGDPKASLF